MKLKVLLYCGDPGGHLFNFIENKNFDWTDDEQYSDIAVYTDMMILKPDKIGKVKIAWILENTDFRPQIVSYIKKNYNEFDYIFTWDKQFLNIDKKFIFLPYGQSFIPESQFSIYSKNKLVSIVASKQNVLAGHKFRHKIISKFPGRMDVYGRAYFPIDTLLPAFKDYMFSFCIENTKRNWSISEKIITPLLCGTVPIYYGCDLSKFFNLNGVITFNDISQVESILDSLTEDKYLQMLPYIEENFEKAKKYKLVEDNLYELFIKLNVIKDL